MIRRILHVASREYIAYVRTKSFVISVLALPITLVLAVALPMLLDSMGGKPARAFTVVDETGLYGKALIRDLRAADSDGDGVLSIGLRDYIYESPPLEMTAERMGALRTSLQRGRLFGLFVISAGDSSSLCSLDYYTSDPAGDELPALVRRLLNNAVAIEHLLPRVGDEELLRRSLRGASVRTHAITEAGEEEATAAHIARSYAPMAFVYLLWISVLIMASHLMTSTVEEKTSRIIEVLLSSVSPFEFMMGKLVGLAGAGLTMISAWVLATVLTLSVFNNPTVSQIGSGLASAFAGATILWFFAFFVLGFLFFASIYVGIGSVCNTIREAQSLTQPLMFILMIPIFLMFYVTQNPDHIVAIIASFVPPFIPFIIMNRIPANPPAPTWQVVLAALILALSTYASIRASAKVFRIGILMYGKPPTLREMLRWARRSD